MLAAALRMAVGAAAAWYLGVYVALACLRLRYPFELEWMEGGSLAHVARVLRGQPLYVPPGLGFIPFQYPPLYYHLSAVAAAMAGEGFLPLRAVSFASSLACFIAIHAIVRIETASRFAALVAAGLFAATYRIGGTWLDIARVDSLFLAFFLVALLALRLPPTAATHAAAGMMFGLSFLAKQTALAMCLPVVALVVVVTPRLGAWLAGALALVAGASTAALHWTSRGWFTFYVFHFPFLHPWARPVLLTFWTRDLLGHLPIAAAAALAGLAAARRSRRSLFWVMTVVGMTGGAYRSRLQMGGYDNVLLPAYAILAILFGVVLGALLGRAGGWAARRRLAAQAAAYAACLVQMALLVYDPRTALPTAADREAGEHALRVIAGMKGDVFVPYHGYLATRAGKRPYAHVMAVFDALKVRLPISEPLAEEHRAAIRERRFGGIVLDDREGYFFMKEIEASYLLASELFDDPAVFFPTTGMRTRPQYVYVPRPATFEPSPHGPAATR